MPPNSKYSDDLAVEILALLERGVPACQAAEACGVAESTYHRWREWGRSGKEPFATFDALARTAGAKWPIPLVDAIRMAAVEDWRAAAWMLERRDPANWGKREPQPQASQSEAKIILLRRPDPKPADA